MTQGALGTAGNLARPRNASPFDTEKSMRVGQRIDQNAFLARSFKSRSVNDCVNPTNTYEPVFKGGPSTTRPDGSTDQTRCPPADRTIAYPTPERVYCLARTDS
jgi:hypothetical protein